MLKHHESPNIWVISYYPKHASCLPHHHQVEPGLEAVHEKAQELERSQLQPKALRISTQEFDPVYMCTTPSPTTTPEATEEDLTQLLGEPGATASWLAHVEEVVIERCRHFKGFKFTGGLAAQVRGHSSLTYSAALVPALAQAGRAYVVTDPCIGCPGVCSSSFSLAFM